MNKENATAKAEEPTARMTRARAKALGKSVGIHPPSKPSFKQEQKRVIRVNSKRPASDENKTSAAAARGLQRKRRAVLKDITNSPDESLYINCHAEANIQSSEQGRREPMEKDVSMGILLDEEGVKTKLAEDLSKIRMVEPQEVAIPAHLEEREITDCSMHHVRRKCDVADKSAPHTRLKHLCLKSLLKKEESKVSDKLGILGDPGVLDIDSNLKDPLACSLYAPDIYDNIRVTELDQRPSTNYMEKLQRDITPNMRGILIDWLVEVSEEYRLVPDTLHLTVNLIDRFLSQNYIEKHRLQLLGVTCMLIASKYEEICAPRVEEFCFITDNTYTRGEVLKMENQVLNFLRFQLSVPTTKTFLRRFIQAAQASCKAPCVELEFLANYLAELTLVEYSFLKFLPSTVAASAVFLARWTLDQSDHPWNVTLEHYTSYKASELKTTVLALEDLQLNTSGCSLHAIREKYRQEKFKNVATLMSPERVLSLFSKTN